MAVGEIRDLDSRGDQWSPAKKHKATFLFSYFSVTKSTKSHLRGLSPPVSATPTNALRALVHSPPLKKYPPRARVSRASHAWRVRATNGKAKVGDFSALRNLILPRVRTHHTKKPSRFVHALSARPHSRVGGRGEVLAADGTIEINHTSLCSHPDTHHNINREVSHSTTWHSSESESAL